MRLQFPAATAARGGPLKAAGRKGLACATATRRRVALALLHTFAEHAAANVARTRQQRGGCTSTLVEENKAEAHAALWPFNVGTATKDGCSILALGMRLATEQRPDFVLVNIDIKNAHNK